MTKNGKYTQEVEKIEEQVLQVLEVFKKVIITDRTHSQENEKTTTGCENICKDIYDIQNIQRILKT